MEGEPGWRSESWGLSVGGRCCLIAAVKWRTGIGLIALVILGLAFVWAALPRDHEPIYQGRALSDWVISERRAEMHEIPEKGPEEAILHIGTNGLPYLVKWLAYSAPRRDLRLFGIPFSFHSRSRRLELTQGSLMAFRILGPRAAPALPDLVNLLKGTNVFFAAQALDLIDAIGMKGIPAILDLVTNRHAYSCGSVLAPIGAMRNLGTNGGSVVPVLAQCLKSPDSETAGMAAILLANTAERRGIGTQTDVAVAALTAATDTL